MALNLLPNISEKMCMRMSIIIHQINIIGGICIINIENNLKYKIIKFFQNKI